jgi:hypothetical protein
VSSKILCKTFCWLLNKKCWTFYIFNWSMRCSTNIW